MLYGFMANEQEEVNANLANTIQEVDQVTLWYDRQLELLKLAGKEKENNKGTTNIKYCQVGVFKNIRNQLLPEPKICYLILNFGYLNRNIFRFWFEYRTDIFLDFWFGYDSAILRVQVPENLNFLIF